MTMRQEAKQDASGLGIEAQRLAVANYLNSGNWRSPLCRGPVGEAVDGVQRSGEWLTMN
jgi:hypothetical protein